MKEKLRKLPSVDEVLKSKEVEDLMSDAPRRYVIAAVRSVLEGRRKAIRAGKNPKTGVKALVPDIAEVLSDLVTPSLRPVINATGIVVHTNLGRSPLPEKALENIVRVARGYSTLEYDVSAGRRGKRYAHVQRLLREITGAEDGIVVNNNAAAVLLCLSAFAKGREVIVSRGELVEIGGSFRVPEVMAQSGAVLREVGATNKTHLRDYEQAITEDTALLLKVHRSNFKISGFTQEVGVDDLVALGKKHGVPVMFDWGSGCVFDMRPHGIQEEPPARELVKSGLDIITFSGDKLLGGPQAGIIIGKKDAIEKLQGHPLLRALRIDKLTLAALESVFMEYVAEETALDNVPTLSMLLCKPEEIKKRAQRLSKLIGKATGLDAPVVKDESFAGGGALPELALPTYAVALKVKGLSPNKLEEHLRLGAPPVIGRIKEDTLFLDARTVLEGELEILAACVQVAAGTSKKSR